MTFPSRTPDCVRLRRVGGLSKSRRSRVYHQFRRNCISPRQSLVYHHCERDIQPTADDIPLLSQWIKKDDSEESSFLVPVTGVDGLCPSFARCSREHPIVFAFGEAVRPLVSNLKKENPHKSVGSLLGAGDRGRRALPVIRSLPSRTPDCVRLRRGGSTPCIKPQKREPTQKCRFSSWCR
jgi:hypothetical protein